MTSGAAARHPGYGSRAYCWYAAFILTLVYTLNAVDRGLPSILLEPVRHEFGLTDSELGLYSGPAYALAYCLAILPMGYVSDRHNRRNVLAVMLVLWSTLTALAAITRSFTQLIATRAGVGAAEAGTVPLILPMISDIFPAKGRGLALGVLYAGAPVGVFLASVGGGFVAAEYGWRASFLICGLPGLLVTAVMMLTVREPQRGGADSESAVSGPDQQPPGLMEGMSFLLKSRGVLCLIAGCALLGLIGITITTWMGSFFVRVHGVGLKEVGLILGVGIGLGGMLSPLVMGWIADVIGVRDERGPIRMVWISALLSFGFSVGMLFTPTLGFAVVLFIASDLTRLGYAPPIYSVIMAHTPARLRGSIMSVLALSTNLMGFGIGPLVTGMISDFYGGGQAIKYALASILVLFVPVVLLFFYASRILYGRQRAMTLPVERET